MVKAHAGGINVVSSPGKGSIFTIYLPASDSAPMIPNFNEMALLPGTENVLVVDDEPMIVEILTQFLISIGYKVQGFINSFEALTQFKSRPDDFDLVLSDQSMPGLAGHELAKAIHTVRPALPIILITGHSELITSTNYGEFGFSAYLEKPLDFNTLATKMRNVIEQKSDKSEKS